jgi:LysM repeat protein
LVGLVFGGVVFLFATLRFLAQAPEPVQSAPAPVVEVTQSDPAPEVVGSSQAAVPAPNESVTRQGGITFTARQIEPTYTVVSGDSLSAIAQRYGTTADALQGINNLPDTMLHVGQKLVLP